MAVRLLLFYIVVMPLFAKACVCAAVQNVGYHLQNRWGSPASGAFILVVPS